MSNDRLRTVARRITRSVLSPLGFELIRSSDGIVWPPDFDDQMIATCTAAAPYTLTSVERIAALIHAVRHISQQGIDGDVVECGVWRGGSVLAASRTLVEMHDTNRQLWLYDTFTRMPPPGERDYDIFGRHASTLFSGPVDPHDTDGYRYLPQSEVRAVIESSGYPAERICLVAGLIEETIPENVPDEIALLRLDTDWYESTKHELEHLYPRLVDGAIVIIDDYGHFTGARAAVDEYLATLSRAPFLHRIDFTGRLFVVRH